MHLDPEGRTCGACSTLSAGGLLLHSAGSQVLLSAGSLVPLSAGSLVPLSAGALLPGFCAGALSLALPWPGAGSWPVWALGGLAVLAAGKPICRACGPFAWLLILGLCLGASWSGWAHDQALAARLNHVGAGTSVKLLLRVTGAPDVLAGAGGDEDGSRNLRFEGRVVEGPPVGGRPTTGIRVRLTWYRAPAVARGEVWSLHSALKGPWSYVNPGGFDYERWLLGADLQATGWVRGGERVEAAAPGPLTRLQERVAVGITDAALPRGGVLLALLTGRSDGIGDDTWQTLRATGTVHLMVISGLHVSLVTALAYGAGVWLWRLGGPLLVRLDARRGGCLLALAAGLGYVALAGAGLPALRALLTTVAVLVWLASGRTGRPTRLLWLVLALLLASDPLAVHQQGFWLSFAAVTLLLVTLGRHHGPRRRLAGLVHTQLALSLGLLPLVALITGGLPWLSVPANLLAVPVMSLGVVPLVVIGGFLSVWAPALAGWLLWAADGLIGLVLAWLDWLAAGPAPPVSASATTLLVAQGAAWYWAGAAPRRHWPVLALAAALALLPQRTGIPSGEFRVIALDVGQGTAILVDTRHHRLLYDAGPGFPGGFETGSAVVVPSVAATGPPRLDVLVLSHDDVDHVGGAAAVQARLQPARVLSGIPGQGRWCDGRHWSWDGVQFRLLKPPRPREASDNDRSCVLLVDNGRRAVLVAGDIGTSVEAGVLRSLADRAPLDLMFAPHHGSGSSSSRSLVRVLRPRWVFVSAARGNRFGHPHPDVVARYAGIGAVMHQTGRHGALVWSTTTPGAVVRWREDRPPYWRAGLPAAESSRR